MIDIDWRISQNDTDPDISILSCLNQHNITAIGDRGNTASIENRTRMHCHWF